MSIPYFRPHENVRLAVAKLVLEITKKVLNRFEKYARGFEKYSIEKLIEFVNNVDYWRVVVPQEVVAGQGFIDMDLFNRIIFELKGRKDEFKDGYNKILKVYLPSHPETLYAIITNYDEWEIYRVKNKKLILIFRGNKTRAVPVLESVIEDVLRTKGYKIPPHPEAVSILFKDILQYEASLEKLLKKVLEAEKEKVDKGTGRPVITPLYEAFETIIKTLYSEADEEFIRRLFVKHTLLQMIVLASLSKVMGITMDPVEMCRGIKLDVRVALPYLNWWYVLYIDPKIGADNEDLKLIEEIAREIVLRVNMIDWNILYLEDVFREFYELMIDRETRRKIGEYYTPLWVVEFMIGRVKELAGGLRGKIVLDPFCGSGTFLVKAFYEKIKEGASPDEAFSEVIGFDINPLAVSIARAELILAYMKMKNRTREQREIMEPLVFHTDTLYSMFRPGIPRFHKFKKAGKTNVLSYIKINRPEGFEKLTVIEEKIISVLAPQSIAEETRKIKENPKENLFTILRLEHGLGNIMRSALAECSKEERCEDKERRTTNVYECLKVNVKKGVMEFFEYGGLDQTVIGRIFTKQMLENIDVFAEGLADLLSKYGDGVWATSIVSILAPLVIKHVKADIIMTNPPWLQLTKFKAYYSDTLMKKSTDLIRGIAGISRGAGKVVMGSDLSSVALYGALGISNDIVAFVMPRKVTFYVGSPQRSGLLLTYAVIKYYEDRIDYVEMIDLGYDAFQHGNIPSLVIIKLKQHG